MEQIPSYNLLQAIDPTKIKVPISERFAKLTLSSNKKQQQKNNEPDQQEELKKQQQKRESITRDISKQFDYEIQEIKNPLLRSESSKETEINNSTGTDAEDLTMEPLEVSEYEECLSDNNNGECNDGDDDKDHGKDKSHDDEFELLTQKVASLGVDSQVTSSSSGSTNNLNVFINVLSSESRPSSSSDVNDIHIVHNIPINVREAVNQETVPLNLTASTNEGLEKMTEMAEEEEDEEEDEPITISDASEILHEPDEDIMAISSMPSTTQTSQNLSLPSMVADKAELVAAFLRDVSIERIAMNEQGHLFVNDTVDRILDNKEIDQIQANLAKSRLIATADTESMTPDVDQEVTSKYLVEREKRLTAFKGLECQNSVKSASIAEIETNENNCHISNLQKSEIITDLNFRRLANNDTLDNTIYTEADKLHGVEKTTKVCTKGAYRIANDETQCNTELTINEETPKIFTNTSNKYLSLENTHRLANLETEDILESPLNDPCRLAKEDTMANSIMSQIDEVFIQQSENRNYSQDYKTPDRDIKKVKNDENKESSSVSLHSTPVSITDFGSKQNSNVSILNSSSELSATVPEASVTILETDDEILQEISSLKNSETSEDKKLSNSFQRKDSTDNSEYDEQMSLIRMSMAKINISAKINIKIQIPYNSSSEASEDEQNMKDNKKRNKASNQLSHESAKNVDDEKAFNTDHSIEPNEESIDIESNKDNQSRKRDTQNYKIRSNNSNLSTELKPLNTDHSIESNEQSMELQSNNDNQSWKRDTQNNKSRNNKSNLSPKVKTKNNYKKTAFENFGNVESNYPTSEINVLQKPGNQMQIKSAREETSSSPNKSSDSVEILENEKFVNDAEKILTQLYGKSWQTPDVIRTLKRTSPIADKRNNSKSSSRKKNDINNSKEKCDYNKTPVEESILDDFAIFRRNIVKTNLDSTRLAIPTSSMQQKEVLTEPKNRRKPLVQRNYPKNLPQTERKTKVAPLAKDMMNKRRGNKHGRWLQLIDSDSEGDNASDDDDADESWSGNASELEVISSDSDFENSPKIRRRNGKCNTNKRQWRSDKSDYLTKKLNKSKEGELVYLDLSKEEVEVQEEIPSSPPANHDLTFASRLQDILQSCRHEEKAKLPPSNTKSKRKLFTPNFGDDDYESITPIDDEIKTKEKTTKINNIAEEILEDNGHFPFDSQGRPKVLDVVNKQLESVKMGKPIFQLTPSPKKQGAYSGKQIKTMSGGSAIKTKANDEVLLKTPLTAKSKGSAKALKDLLQTPEYKYSFLKSLDVTVSKTLCHPDALYYRDNYRTKKEDLANILYDMYNEKLFDNKLEVPLKWNKKLLNTAGRCLNKKKLDIRSSVVELSEKVLTSADRLRCTLIHELCHAATWIFQGEGGHGSAWKEWARKANAVFPEIPKIGVCHQYNIEYKYTYKCTLCAAKSHAHSKSKKVENIRCSYCHGAIEIFLNKKDKDGNVIPTPVKEPTGFAKFVKDNYKKFKRDDLKHADVMKLLSSEFASIKVSGK